ncbi:MAG: LysR family transcriptional regulator [Rhodospirillales bacterium]|jgi:DNA-binding transcriptional LysR family regulator
MPPDLRLFHYAVAVADEGGFSRAAARLGIAQPPLSQQIRRLEAALGVVLFERTAGGAVPTPAGMVFLDRARAVLRDAGEAVDAARRAARGEEGRLAIAIAGGAMFSFLPGLLRDFRLRRPGVAMDLSNLSPDEQVDALEAGRIDVGFAGRARMSSGVVAALAHAEPFVAALPADHPLSRRRVLALRDLADDPFVMFARTQASGLHADVLDLCRGAGFTPRIVQEIAPMHAVVGLVGAGLGVAVVPRSVRVLRFSTVVYRPFADAAVPSQIFMLHRSGGASPAAAAFVAFAGDRTA